MWKWLIAQVLKGLQLVDVDLHWRGGEHDEFRVVITFMGKVLLDRTFDVIRD